MIIFEKVRWKNFLSTGQNAIEINLNQNKSTLIVGQNGAGKSTMLDAISFALFGKAHRNIKKDQLVNSINNKGCEVDVEFTIGQNKFKVFRGIKPNKFEIYKNGTMINQSSHAKEYQQILESNILKLNHKTFHQVVVLGSSSFIPFMQLTGSHRREVIEDLLDINVFSKMNQILKEKTNTLKDNVKEINYAIDIQNNKIATQDKYINDVAALTEESKKEYESRIHASQNNIDELQDANNVLSTGLEESIGKTEERHSTLSDKRQGLMLRGQDRQTNLSNVRQRITFFEENEVCSVCDQTISDSHKHDILNDAKEEANSIQSECRTIGTEGSSVEKEINENGLLLQSLRSKVSQLGENNREISTLQEQIRQYQKSLDKEVSADLTSAKTDRDEMKSDKDKMLESKINLSEQFNYNIVIGEMLKDSGIKTKIIKQYLPAVNKFVNTYLQILDFFVHFNLDEAFNETIRSRHRDEFTYESFSEGEKQRIDLSLLFTWRQIAKMKNSVATNLLILDETFDSSLDHDGVDNLLKILHTLGDDTNIFVISHKGEILDGKFNSKIEFKKEKNFSKMLY